MNERIKQILLKVVPMAGEDGEYLPFLHTPEDIEKFAELLIRECASYINERTLDWDADLRWVFNDGSGFMDVDVTDLLNKHFGVKEIMLKDRILLLDEEIKKHTAYCGMLYKELAIVNWAVTDRTEYDAALARLNIMLAERHVIAEMISSGHP